MPLVSAGLLMCRKLNENVEFFLVHPGGPYFAKKDEGVWSIPKGLVEKDEPFEATAEREFFEETGLTPRPPFHPIGTVVLRSKKIIHAWTFLGEWLPEHGITSNKFKMEWPPRSGKFQMIDEIDRAAWMQLDEAKRMITAAQIPFLERAIDIWT